MSWDMEGLLLKGVVDMDGLPGRAARFAAGHLVEGIAGGALALAAPLAVRAAHGLAGLAGERLEGLALACASSFLLGLSLGLAMRIPGRIRTRAESRAIFEMASRELAEMDRREFLSLDRITKTMLVEAEASGGSALVDMSGTDADAGRAPELSTDLIQVSDFGSGTVFVALTDNGKRVLDNSRDLVDAFKKVQEENLEG